ncbi:hypothetical protein ACFWXA_30975 [Streptomyces atroolivaceus]|uniref:hypothetical protein n=1 Tax=Streptomyces atroolivaceus TaxID=66869 RepID=UPI003654CF77
MTDLPLMLATWFSAHAAELRAAGIRCALEKSPADGRSKNAARIVLEPPARLASICVRDTGDEAEPEGAEVAHGRVHSEHGPVSVSARSARPPEVADQDRPRGQGPRRSLSSRPLSWEKGLDDRRSATLPGEWRTGPTVRAGAP